MLLSHMAEARPSHMVTLYDRSHALAKGSGGGHAEPWFRSKPTRCQRSAAYRPAAERRYIVIVRQPVGGADHVSLEAGSDLGAVSSSFTLERGPIATQRVKATSAIKRFLGE
jgi:hypothetical protein